MVVVLQPGQAVERESVICWIFEIDFCLAVNSRDIGAIYVCKIKLQESVFREGDHLKLTCAAYGDPRPMISWNRVDGNAIPSGSWRGEWKENSF